MNKIITSAAIVLLVTFYLQACKKSDKQQTTIEKIQAKWNLVSDVVNEHVSGMDHINTTTGSSGDILDFRTDGKVYTSIQGSTDTSSYALSGDTKIIINGVELYNITTLTSSSFILDAKRTSGSSDFIEETITLKK